MSVEAMRQALEVLEQINQLSIGENAISLPGEIDAAMDNLRAAIEQAETQSASGSYVSWDNTLCNPLAPAREQARSAWYDGYKSAKAEQYDQTSLELCKECGWKAIIPGEGCLVCARQKAKPVAYADSRIHGWPDCFVMEPDPPHTVPLYTEPRQWVGLTAEEINAIYVQHHNQFGECISGDWGYERDIEAKLRGKNHAG